jgi:hypothetical protein
MPTVKLPIFESIMKGVDGIELNDENFSLIDGYRTLTGGTTNRFGSKQTFVASTASGVGFDAMFYWAEKDCVIAVGGGEVYRLTYISNTPVITSLTAGTPLLNQNTPTSITVDGTNYYAANGGQIVYGTPTGSPAYIADPDAPTAVSHVDFLDGYILAIDPATNRFYWSDVNAGTSWNALSFASGAGSPDLISSLKVLNREIYLFGQRSIEIWENDGATPFARVPGGFIQSGCSAPYAVLQDEGALYWIDENRRLVRFAGKSVERLSTKFDRELQGLSSVADGVAMNIQIDGYVFFVFTFKKANRTLVYNQTTNDWCEFGKWDYANAAYERWVGNCYCYAEKWGLHLLGRRDTLVISELSRIYPTDDSDSIRLARVTGHIDHGTSKFKQCNEIRFRAKRGQGLSSVTPKLMMRYKIDNRSWSNIKEFSLGDIGEYDIILRDFRRNQYRTKQYEFTATDAVEVTFSQAEEDIEVLR